MERRTDIDLQRGFVLVVKFDPATLELRLRIAQWMDMVLAMKTPHLAVADEEVEPFRQNIRGAKITIADPRLECPLLLLIKGGALYVRWMDHTLIGHYYELLDAIRKPDPPKIMRPMFPWNMKPGVDAELPVSIEDGKSLIIEKRNVETWVRLAGVPERTQGDGSRLIDNLDLRSPTTYTWLTQGGIAVRLLGDDKAAVYYTGHIVGHVSLRALRAGLKAIGGKFV